MCFFKPKPKAKPAGVVGACYYCGEPVLAHDQDVSYNAMNGGSGIFHKNAGCYRHWSSLLGSY